MSGQERSNLEIRDKAEPDSTKVLNTQEAKVKKSKKKKKSKKGTDKRSDASSSSESSVSPSKTNMTKEEFYDAHESFHGLPPAENPLTMAVTQAQSPLGPEIKIEAVEPTAPVGQLAAIRQASTTVTKPSEQPDKTNLQ